VSNQGLHCQIVPGDLQSSEILCSREWELLTDVSEQPIGPIFKCQEIQKRELSMTEVKRHNFFLFTSMSDYLKKHGVFKDRCFHFQAKKPLTWKDPWIELFSITVTHRNSTLLSYERENKSSPRVITGKWLLKIKKIN
jgi:hypothetical protein